MSLRRLSVVGAVATVVLVGCGHSGGSGDASSGGTSAATTAANPAAAPAAAATSRTPDIFDSMTSTPSPDGDITMAQIREHTTAKSCWTTIDGGVYDVTAWIPVHYGGPKAIEKLCGADGTARFKRQHATFAKAVQRLETYRIGTLKG